MIKIEVDEAYAYDMLAIAVVKFAKKETDECLLYLKNINTQIEQGIGLEKHAEIKKSKEFNLLTELNLNIFDYIDEMMTNPSIEDGVWVNQQNYKRFLAKKALQEKFFPEQKLLEQKIGYDK